MKQLTVIGAGGQMGQWFTNYFSGSEYEVTGYDSESNDFGKNVKVSESLVGAILKQIMLFYAHQQEELQK